MCLPDITKVSCPARTNVLGWYWMWLCCSRVFRVAEVVNLKQQPPSKTRNQSTPAALHNRGLRPTGGTRRTNQQNSSFQNNEMWLNTRKRTQAPLVMRQQLMSTARHHTLGPVSTNSLRLGLPFRFFFFFLKKKRELEEKSAAVQKKGAHTQPAQQSRHSCPNSSSTAVVDGVSPFMPKPPRCSKSERPKDRAALQANRVLQRRNHACLADRLSCGGSLRDFAFAT